MGDCLSCVSADAEIVRLTKEKDRLESLLVSLKADVKLHQEFEVRGS